MFLIVMNDLHISLGLESSAQLSILTRELPTVAKQFTAAVSLISSTSMLQLTRNGSGRGGGNMEGSTVAN